MKTKIIVSLAGVMIAPILLGFLFWNGTFLLNNPSTEQYPVRGVDVSSYQGEIDWPVLAAQKIDFAFLKAPEGSSFVDKHFADNLAGAQKTDLRVGAYHFFSYDSSGATQAENFIATVPKFDLMLPPVVDVEFYGDKEKKLPDKASTQAELKILLDKLKTHYGIEPILYVTEKSYELYIAGTFPNYDIWIRNVTSAPKVSDNNAWTFWQYTNRAHLDGYHGDEKYIDMNVFAGTPAAFASY